MSYTKNTWKSGDTVTSAKLNKMEQGIAGCANILIINTVTEDDVTALDKTWQEIFDADMPFIVEVGEDFKGFLPVTEINVDEGEYVVRTSSTSYIAQTADDYPIYDAGSVK